MDQRIASQISRGYFFIHLGLEQFGKDWRKIEIFVGTRSGAQIRSHAQKYFIKMGKESNEQENTHEEVDSSNNEAAIEDQTSEHSFFFSKMYLFFNVERES